MSVSAFPSRRLVRSVLAGAAILASGPAFAWDHIGQAWDANALPLPYEISTTPEDSVSPELPFSSIEQGFQAWIDQAPCSFLSVDYLGTTENNTPFANSDHHNRFTFDDPGDDLEAGVLAATLCGPYTFNYLKTIDGRQYKEVTDCDIVYNNDVDFVSDEDIAADNCNGETSMRAVTTHEIGHLWGMGHSCEDPGKGGGPCYDPLLLEATMYWTAGPCETAQSDLAPDDIEGITALYGPYASIECSNELAPDDPDTIAFGKVPFDLRCSVQSDRLDEVQGATWHWGDGNESSGTNVTYTYAEAGNYTLSAEINGQNESCGEWNYTARKVGYVRACAVPEPKFSYDHQDGLTYRLLNETDVSVYGCIYNIQWDVFDSSGTLVESLAAWEPKFTFPDAGEYRVVLNIGGPAGTGAAELTIDARNVRGEGYGCSSVPAGAGWSVAVLGLLALRRRRS